MGQFYVRKVGIKSLVGLVPQSLSWSGNLPDEDMVRVEDALGWLNVFNPFRTGGTYRLNLNRPDEKRVTAAVMELVRVPMDVGRAALMQAFPSGTFAAPHRE